MNKIKDRALTYSLLAHIRNRGQLIKGPVEVFIPLIKRTLSKLNEKGVFSGKSIVEIKNEADYLYSIDFPIPVIRTILSLIAKEVNSENEICFVLFQDDAFQIKNYTFTEFEETIRIHNVELSNLEKLYKDFCETLGEEKPDSLSILEFIEKSRFSLSKYLAHKHTEPNKDYTIEAQFVDFFKKIPSVYDTIRKIYLGSILVGYVEYRTEAVKTNVELLLDTNFILGLFDLNTPESTHTCRKILEIVKIQGYKLSILIDTISEIRYLLKAKAQNFNMSFLQKKIYPEDIYNACERRNLNVADIERITDNLENDLGNYGIAIVYDTTKYKNLAKYSNEFEYLKTIRTSERSAFHDATAIQYVRNKRIKKIREFENVNCWFLNNSLNRDKYINGKNVNEIEFQPDLIRADDFLNIIWLSNPQITRNINMDEVVEIGLSSLVSLSLTASLPKLSIIKELDDNISKYAEESNLSDEDILRVATRITTKQLTDIDGLNKLANTNKEEFVKRLNEEAKKQKEIEEEKIKKLDKVLKDFIDKSSSLAKIKTDFEEKSKKIDERITNITGDSVIKDKTIDELRNQLDIERQQRKKESLSRKKKERNDYINTKVKKWQNNVNYELIIWGIIFIVSVVYILYLASWNINLAIGLYKNIKDDFIFGNILFILGLIFTGFTIKKWYDRHHNYSNIENYKKNIEIPENLIEEE
ncbi:hypothetical protein DUE52_19985 [Larkinella punicea]|uniref:PIN domain-containing protein n=2 Tax=Larkinella punicea TaxID=2315727 RepID=A0A368JJ54_9BACT|nr:hypothetical protein DUE52_19985 [Larkinella punicea]